MAKVIVLGGCGAVGSVAVKTLVNHGEFSEVVIGDYDSERGRQLLSTIGPDRASFVQFDALDVESVRNAVGGCDLVVNCVGPFYTTVKPILETVIEERINYVDVCDDVDVTLSILEMDGRAKEAGITALIGMGNSPGITNLLGKLAAETLMEEIHSVDIFHAHGGEPVEGVGVIEHRFHCMSIDIPMFLDGELKYVKFFEEDGIELRQPFDFPVLGEVMLYPYPHPEQVTLPNYIDLKQVTNKGTVLPAEYYDLTKELCRLGLNGREPVMVGGESVIPYDFAVAYILRERERILAEASFGEQRGCCTVIAKGKNHGKYREYRFHMASRSQALGEGTGIPVAIGAILLNRGEVRGKGVMPPEACVDPMGLMGLLPEVMDLDRMKEGGESFGGLIIEKVDEDGNVTKLDM